MSERFMELARDHQDQLEREALAEVRARAAETMPPDWDGKTCYDCSDSIFAGRLALGKFRCIACQELKDRGSQLYRR